MGNPYGVSFTSNNGQNPPDETALAADSMSGTIAAIRGDAQTVASEIDALGRGFAQVGDRLGQLKGAADSFSTSVG